MLYQFIKGHIERMFPAATVYLGTNPDEEWVCIINPKDVTQGPLAYVATMDGDSEVLRFNALNVPAEHFRVELTDDEWKQIAEAQE